MAKPRITSKEAAALLQLFDAQSKLKALGWKDPHFFSFAEGKVFELIELGSTGIHEAVYRHQYCWVDGEWPSMPYLVREVKKEPDWKDEAGKKWAKSLRKPVEEQPHERT